MIYGLRLSYILDTAGVTRLIEERKRENLQIPGVE